MSRGRDEGTISAIIDKGFGFIVEDPQQDGTSDEYFFHSTAVKDGTDFENLHPGDRVAFTKLTGAKGKRAVGIEKL
jgi:CspA family cold shock protein